MKEGDRVLCYHGPLLYEAKVVTVDNKPAEDGSSKGRYFVHYKGWKQSWDEWVPNERVLAWTEENLATQKDLRDARKSTAESRRRESAPKASNSATKEGANAAATNDSKGVKRGRDTDIEKEKDFNKKPEIQIAMPDTLKSQLVDDWENITKNTQLLPIPRQPNVRQIVEEYRSTVKKFRPGSAQAEIFEEVLAGIILYFDRCLGNILLYRFERQQYLEAKQDKGSGNKQASELYGAEHLLRLFVSLPELIAHTNMDSQSIAVLREHIEDFLKFLARKQSTFFLKDYENANPNYLSLSKTTA